VYNVLFILEREVKVAEAELVLQEKEVPEVLRDVLVRLYKCNPDMPQDPVR
jgi:hypothetical protein